MTAEGSGVVVAVLNDDCEKSRLFRNSGAAADLGFLRQTHIDGERWLSERNSNGEACQSGGKQRLAALGWMTRW